MPPQPSGPHCLPLQSGVQPWGATHLYSKLQVLPWGQVPQVPPQPSDPQSLSSQTGVQLLGWKHWPLKLQIQPAGQVPQVPLQPSDDPQLFPLQLGVQLRKACRRYLSS